MSEEMAVSDNATGENIPMRTYENAADNMVQEADASVGRPSEEVQQATELQPPHSEEPQPEQEVQVESQVTSEEDRVLETEVKQDPKDLVVETTDIKNEVETNTDQTNIEPMDTHKIDIETKTDEINTDMINEKTDSESTTDKNVDEKRGVKRRASDAFSDNGDGDFQGFDDIKQDTLADEYSQILERLEAEVLEASKTYTPVRYVMATPPASMRAIKRPRKDTGTDGSRPSSAQSSRSEDDPSASPVHRGRKGGTDLSSPLLRVPLDRGWKRELVYRAALDQHSRRNADIYYYTPEGKKLRSTREISENLSGTGLTLENFSFFKEPLGVDDPEKEIIRDAKLIRRVESPVTAVPSPVTVEGKRPHKPKAPKGASPEPPAKVTPAKIKVKSMGSRVSGASTPTKPEKKKVTATTTPTQNDNNNSAAWKKPRPPAAPDQEPGMACLKAPTVPIVAPIPLPVEAKPASVRTRSRSSHASAGSREVTPVSRDITPAPAPPPVPPAVPRLATPPPQPQRLQEMSSPDITSPRRVLQPCSLTCGSGVPSLSCPACLCMYHPRCAGVYTHNPPSNFLCKNCRKSSSPPPVAPVAKNSAGPAPAKVPAPNKPNEKRVTLRMKMSGGSDGNKVWAVTPPRSGAPRRSALPQSLALINGKRFIVVPRPAPLPPQPNATHETKTRGRVSNGNAPVAAVTAPSPRRRGRPRADDTDHFTAFYNKAQQGVVVQIFQYLGMRDLAHCARVCKLWRQLAATPALWRHVRMKNSQVSDWGGLCAALKRHGTKWLDLRKMLLPQNDAVFWEQFAQHIASVDTLERLEMCRCPARAVEAAAGALPALRVLTALAIRDGSLDPAPLARASQLTELRLKSMSGLALTADLTHLAKLTHLNHLSLTSIKELGWRACDVIGSLPQLESLELGECTFRAEFAQVLARLTKLTRLRLERGTAACAAPAILRALARLPRLQRLELVNVDVKVGFDDALAECKNIQRLLIIPTYVSQSATTNKQVLSGVLRLKETLTHLMWGVTIELLRVTELFIDQCSAGGGARRDLGECIPVLKPVPGCRLPMDHQLVAGPPQVEILPLPTLQRLLSAQLPNTKLKLLRIPFHATWRQSLADFQ